MSTNILIVIILIAGGGTGDPTLSCANSFFRAGIPVQVVHLDLSMSSNQIAMARVKHLLDPMLAQQIFFIRGSISDISKMIKIRSSGGGDGDVLDRGKLSQQHNVNEQHRHRQPFDTGNSQHVCLVYLKNLKKRNLKMNFIEKNILICKIFLCSSPSES